VEGRDRQTRSLCAPSSTAATAPSWVASAGGVFRIRDGVAILHAAEEGAGIAGWLNSIYEDH